MAKKVGDYKIPFDRDGNQQHYPEYWWIGQYPNNERAGPEWRDNVPFQDTITYKGFSRGRSAAYFRFEKSDGKEVTVFLKELDEMMPRKSAERFSL